MFQNIVKQTQINQSTDFYGEFRFGGRKTGLQLVYLLGGYPWHPMTARLQPPWISRLFACSCSSSISSVQGMRTFSEVELPIVAMWKMSIQGMDGKFRGEKKTS
jgi:hypothetical protein